MKIAKKNFYYVGHAHDTLTINTNVFGDYARPILWNNKGLFCIMSRQKVQNILDIMKDQRNLPVLSGKVLGVLHWDDGRLVGSEIAAMLLS